MVHRSPPLENGHRGSAPTQQRRVGGTQRAPPSPKSLLTGEEKAPRMGRAHKRTGTGHQNLPAGCR